MSSTVKDTCAFVRRNKGKLLLAGIIGGGYYAYRQYRHMLTLDYWLPPDIRLLLEQMPSAAADADDPVAAKSGAGDVAQSSRGNPHRLSEQLIEVLTKVLNSAEAKLNQNASCESLREQLRVSESNEDKRRIWDALKETSWMRCVVAIYTLCHAILLLKVQIALTVKNIQLSRSTDDEATGDQQMRLNVLARYLDGVDYLTEQGLVDLVTSATSCVQRPISAMGLGEALNVQGIRIVAGEIRKLMESQSNGHQQSVHGFPEAQTGYHMEFLLAKEFMQGPHTVDGLASDERFMAQLAAETCSILSGVEARLVLACMLEESFSYVLDQMSRYIKSATSGECANGGESLPHAKLLPPLARMPEKILAVPGTADSLCDILLKMKYADALEDRIISGSQYQHH